MKTRLIPLLFCLALPCWAGQDEAETAVGNMLFNENMENASFKVRSNGFVDILFGAAVSDADYIRLVEKLRAHPDIKGVLPGKSTSNFCPIK
jgi:hypothetical protein